MKKSLLIFAMLLFGCRSEVPPTVVTEPDFIPPEPGQTSQLMAAIPSKFSLNGQPLTEGEQVVGPLTNTNIVIKPSATNINVRIIFDGKTHVEGNPPFSAVQSNFTLNLGQHHLEYYCYAYPAWQSGPIVEKGTLNFSVIAGGTGSSNVLSNPPWAGMDGKTTLLKLGGKYYVPKSWGICNAHNWTMQTEDGDGPVAQIIFQDPSPAAWLLIFSQSSSGNTLKRFNIVTGPTPLTNRNGIILSGTNNTIEEVGSSGGNTQYKTRDGDSIKNLHLLSLFTTGDIGGYFIYGGSGVAGKYSGFLMQDCRIICGIASNFGIAHPIRLYDIGNGILKDNIVDIRSSLKYKSQFSWVDSAAGIRLHRGTDGILVQGGDYAGFQSWISPLKPTEPPLNNVICDGATFRNSINIQPGAHNIVFQNCSFITGSSHAFSISSGTSGKFINCKFITTASTPIFDRSGGHWTFSGCTKNGKAYH